MQRLPAPLRTLVEEPVARMALRAKLMEPYRRFRFHSFGPKSILHRPEWIYGPEHISIGTGVLILQGAILSAERSSWDRPGPSIVLGDYVGLRPHCTISAAESIVIESRVAIGSFSTIIDNDHTVSDGDRSILETPSVTAPVRVGEGTWIGERVAVLRGSNIGRGCVIGANSVVRGEIPDYSVAVGAPARVVGSTREG